MTRFYVTRSDQPGMREANGLEGKPNSAVKIMAQYQANAPKNATLQILREDFSAFRIYRYTLADDGYYGWHQQDEEETR